MPNGAICPARLPPVIMGAVREVVLTAILLWLAGISGAAEIHKWVDENGRVHFSNRAPDSSTTAVEAPPSGPGEGWESVLERREGTDEFSERADAVLNGLTLDLRRKKRERDRAREEVERIRSEMVRHQELRNPAAAYALQPAEVEHRNALQQLELDVARLEASIERVKAIKAMGREQAERQLGQNPFFQYGQ